MNRVLNFLRIQFKQLLFSRAMLLTEYYRSNYWHDPESRSGPGSSLHQTLAIREAIPGLINSLAVKSVLDLPCGDLHWFKCINIESIDYTGGISSRILLRPTKDFMRPPLRGL